jgi:hypothetical protein
MFARKVAARLKPNSLTEFIDLMEREIVPWLWKQEGFVDLITLAAPDGVEVATISFWDRNGNVQAYDSSGYPEMLKILAQILDGTPYVKNFEVVRSTFQRVVLAGTREADNLAQETGSAELGYRSYETSVWRNLSSGLHGSMEEDSALSTQHSALSTQS